MKYSASAAAAVVLAALALPSSSDVAAFAPSTSFGVRRSDTTATSSNRKQTATVLYTMLDRKTGQSQLDPAVIDRYNALPFPADKVLAEYVWVDADGNTRSKTRTLTPSKVASVDALPEWNFDGSSTGQAPGDDSEVILKPRRIFRDPFRVRTDGLHNILGTQDRARQDRTGQSSTHPSLPSPPGQLTFTFTHLPHSLNHSDHSFPPYSYLSLLRLTTTVMCDTWTPQGEPLPTNTRAAAMKAFEGKDSEEIWFGMEQEFTLFNLDERTPLGWPKQGFPSRPQGPYYCSVGPENNFGRHITDSMYRACLYAGIEISGTNGEVMPVRVVCVCVCFYR